MLDRELDKFWENDEKAHRNNCFAVESQIAFVRAAIESG